MKIQATSAEQLKMVKFFGRGGGHWPLFTLQRMAQRDGQRYGAGERKGDCLKGYKWGGYSMHKGVIMTDIQKSVFALWDDLYYHLIVQIDVKNKD